MTALIKIKDLTKEFNHHVVLNHINATVNQGDVISLIGPSGVGKSTFIRCINMLGKPTSGQVILDGQDLTQSSSKQLVHLRTKIGTVFQSFNLFKNKTILKNITLAPIKVKGIDKDTAKSQAMDLLKTVGLADKAGVYPSTLSGGQAQRVAIVRALAMHPKVMLFDEPTSALDPQMVGEVLGVMKHLAKQHMTMIIVTHEMAFAKEVSNQIWYLNQGKIQEKSTPQTFFTHPKTKSAQEFLSKMI